MKLNQQNTPNQNTIRAFESGNIKINNKSYHNSLLLSADFLDENWPVNNIEALTAERIEDLLTHKPVIILIGSGEKHHFLDPMLTMIASKQGVGIEIMTTEAACRTYNVLLGEDRAVLAALII